MSMSQKVISLTDPLFIHGEACAVAGIDPKHLNNWVQRDVIALGEMIDGRRRYSIIDLIRLRIIADTAHFLKAGPAFGNAISEMVLPRAAEVAELDADGELKFDGYGDGHYAGEFPQYLIAWSEPESDKFAVRRVAENHLIAAIKDPKHSIIVVPLDEISLSVTLSCLEIIDRERAEVPPVRAAG